MIDDLKPYPEMKDSGVEWLGKIPSHWKLNKLRTLLRSVAVRNRPDLPLLSVVRKKGVIVRDVSSQGENHNFIPDDLSNYKVVRRGQFAMNKMKAWQGSFGISRHDGVVSPAYFVFELDGVSGEYFNSAIRSNAYVPFFARASDGVRIGQWDLSQARMREIPFAIPPLAEQAAVVRFLDHVDRRIRRLINAKRKLIALLMEQKQAIIHRAVTRGLDPDVPLKDSGVEWLRGIPEHWKVMPLKRLFASMDYGISDSGEADGAIAVLTMGHIRDGEVRVPTNGGVPTVDRTLLLQDKDLLFNRTNSAALVAKVGLFRSADRPATFASYLVRMRSRLGNDPEFLCYLLNEHDFLARARREAIPSLHQSNLNPTRYGRLLIALPPSVEQVKIRKYLSKVTSTMRKALDRAKLEIELVDHLCTRLVADVVTGKLDVREAAAKLPEIDPLDEGDGAEEVVEEEALGLEDIDTVVEEAAI